MKISSLVSVLAVVILSGCTAEAPSPIEVSKSTQINAGIEDVWGYAGDFCAIGTWHPAIENCEITEEEGSTLRILTLGDGAQIREKHNSDMSNGYAYSIIEGPLPVRDYDASFQVEGDDQGTTITWTANFYADGVPDDEAEGIIAGVFEGGLDSIKGNFE